MAGGTASAAGHVTLTVYAASSLTDVLPKVDPAERYSFGGSNTLAAQITQGAPADIFASANIDPPGTAVRKGARDTAARAHSQHTRPHRPADEPGPHPLDHRPAQTGRQARHRRFGSARRGRTRCRFWKTMLDAGPTYSDNVVSLRDRRVCDVLAKVALGEADAGFCLRDAPARTVPNKAHDVAATPSLGAASNVPRSGIAVVDCEQASGGGSSRILKNASRQSEAQTDCSRAYGFLPRRTAG